MDLDALRRLLEKNEALRTAAQSREAQTLAGAADEQTLRAALARGDSDSLQNAVRQLLATPEGRRLAQQVSDAVKRNG